MKVVGIHGINNNYVGAPQLKRLWCDAINTGLSEAGATELTLSDFGMIGYGAVFRPSGVRGASTRPVEELSRWEQELLMALWEESERLSSQNRNADAEDPRGEEPTIQGPDFSGRARVPGTIQRALDQITRTKYFRSLGGDIVRVVVRQVNEFLCNPSTKQKVLQRVDKVVDPENTQVLIGHSLGSLIAYEALCANPQWKVKALVTLGSPIGISGLVFDVLTPRPQGGLGHWPNVSTWTNIVDEGDIVAMVKLISPLFPAPEGRGLNDQRIYNGWRSHDVLRYLSAVETGRAISEGLT